MKNVTLVTTLLFLAACHTPPPNSPIPVSRGGTGARNASEARLNLDVAARTAPNVFTAPQQFADSLRSTGGAVFSNRTDFLGDTTFIGDITIRRVPGYNLGSDVLLEFVNVYDERVASVDVDGVFSGTGSGLRNLDANELSSGSVPDGRLADSYSQVVRFDNADNAFVGNGSGLTQVSASRLSDLEFGQTSSTGCTLAPFASTPDCSACPTCVVTPANNDPVSNWMHVATYDLNRNGAMSVTLDRSLMCLQSATGSIRLDLILKHTSDPEIEVLLGTTDVTMTPTGSNSYFIVPQPRLEGTLLTEQHDLELAQPYDVFVRATNLKGNNTCYLTSQSVSLQFAPVSGMEVAIDPQ